jgi:chorismate mutase/prephenate dehydratase
LGPKGTFSEIATTTHFGNSVEKIETENIRDIFKEVARDKNSYGVIPFENSIEGMVNQSLDNLIGSNLKICSELELPIEHCLFSAEKNMKKLNTIYGHPQALAQCRNWLSKNLPRARIVETESSANAAQLVKNKAGKGSIGPKKISEIYSLNLLKEKIQDQITNTTRFLVIGNEFPGKTSDDKTSISLSLNNEQGALLKVLQIVKKNKINLTNILSRPVKKNKWQYSFFLEFSGHASDKNVLKLFKELQKVSYDLKVLGSYPAAY